MKKELVLEVLNPCDPAVASQSLHSVTWPNPPLQEPGAQLIEMLSVSATSLVGAPYLWSTRLVM